MIRLVQISNGKTCRVALVDEPNLRLLAKIDSAYALAKEALRGEKSLGALARELATESTIDYDSVYQCESEWHLLSPIDVPGDPTRMLVSGTGLTHLGSATDRQAMHAANPQKTEMTDSMKMFQLGVEGGRPAKDEIGFAPEWFYKGNGSVLQPPFSPLTIPAYAEDGGEEAEIAGIYMVGEDAIPYRIGFAVGNEFSDHKFEKRNYLNLAASKLRNCSIGPELVVGASFDAISGIARIERASKVIWEKKIATGEANMCHSLSNLEHHHFKFEGHRQPGSIHVHFVGAYSLSFGDGIELQDGDWMEIRYEGFGRALRNAVQVAPKSENKTVAVKVMS